MLRWIGAFCPNLERFEERSIDPWESFPGPVVTQATLTRERAARLRQVYMYPNGTGPPQLDAALGSQSPGPSAAALLVLSNVSASPPALTPAAPVRALAPSAAFRACWTRPRAAADSLAAASPACAAAVSTFFGDAPQGDDSDPAPPAPGLLAAACAGGCVPRLRAALGAALSECAAQWALVPIAPGDLNGTAGGVPTLLNRSGLVQVVSPQSLGPTGSIPSPHTPARPP